MKCTELLCYGTGESDIESDTFLEKITVAGAMISAHFLTIMGTLHANYDKFDINCKDIEQFVSEPPAAPNR